jgi:hypothetical protein
MKKTKTHVSEPIAAEEPYEMTCPPAFAVKTADGRRVGLVSGPTYEEALRQARDLAAERKLDPQKLIVQEIERP